MGFMNVYEPMYIYIIQYYTYCTLIIIYIFLQVGQTKIGYYTTLPHSSESLLDFHHAWDRDICPENMSWKYCESERNGTAMWIFVVLCHIMYCHTTLYNIIQHYNLSQRLLWLQTSTRRGHDAGLSWTRKTRNRRNQNQNRKNQSSSPIKRYKTWHPLTMSWTVAGEIEVFWPGVRRLRFGEHPSRLYCTRMAREWTTAWCLLYRILCECPCAAFIGGYSSVIQCRYAAGEWNMLFQNRSQDRSCT